MTGVRLRIDDREVMAALRNLAERGSDASRPLREFGDYLHRVHRERFSAQQAPDGTPWAPLSPGYAKRKKKNSDKVLLLDGYLRGLLRYQVDGNRLTFGTDRPYAATHQFGDAKRRIPPRPFLGPGPSDYAKLLAILTKHLRSPDLRGD